MNEQQSAFPTSGLEYTDKGKSWAQAGMTLRDYFAAKALPSMLAAHIPTAVPRGFDVNWRGIDWKGISKDAYSMADAMIEARG
ncbi:hypothetical protein UFOVP275_76 [uncultured Caudovirales phage]|uniref:Uncharacterized protein n=1 Tax=uncultured Caudovirales phage TaxID=2100421 RepID=A0A6J5LLG3_9CAUD|nr:hypothetical protein UFOVP275_76 [uncultured Caudovirales phage]